MFRKTIEKELYCYGKYQPFGEMIKNITNKGMPSQLDSFAEWCNHNLDILDDLIDDIVRETEMHKFLLKVRIIYR